MSFRSDFDAMFGRLERLNARGKAALLRIYKSGLTDARKELAEFFAKYETQGALTYAEMAKYNRLDAMTDALQSKINEMTGKSARLIKNLTGENFKEGFYGSAFSIEKEADKRLGFGILPDKAVEASIMNPISGLTLNERLSRNRAQVIIKTREQITQGLLRGESYGKMSGRLKEVFEGDAKKALRVASTEAHRAQNEGILRAGEESEEKGVQMMKVWDATLDDKTRDDHGAMDGVKVEVDDDFELPDGSSGPAPGEIGEPEHDINCRCRLRYEVKGYAPDVRRVRGEGVQPYQTYTEWKASKAK